MVNRCGVARCNGNYSSENKVRVFKLPKCEADQQRWINALPPRANFVIKPKTFYICERHWPPEAQFITTPGGFTRPVDPPSIFPNVPSSCLQTPKPPPRPPKDPNKNLDFFNKRDKIRSFAEFSPDKELKDDCKKRGQKLIISRTEDKFICIFMSDNFSECTGSIIVHNKPTLCSPLVIEAFQSGIRLTTLSSILNPNNGLAKYSQFFAVVNNVINGFHSLDNIAEKVASVLESAIQCAVDYPLDKMKKLQFITRQLQLLHSKHFRPSDYCFAVEIFPRCSYEHLREFIILPSKRKLQSIFSTTDIDKVLTKTFQKLQVPQQKLCFLIVDEVKIRPTVAYAGGALSGMAANNPELKATAMLGVLMKCLHGGPSLMISVTPVCNLTAEFQYDVVLRNATVIEKCGGTVVGSITDNHKINQRYSRSFNRIENEMDPCQAIHPLDESRIWFLLFDPVHLLKCIRNNWITEKCRKLTFDGVSIGNFEDVRAIYSKERESILKTTPLTYASVYPSQLQRQNVQHVLRVFNEKVIAALRLENKNSTADFIQQVLTWWNIQNVSSKGQDIRMRDPSRAVQTPESTNLQLYADLFKQAESGKFIILLIWLIF